MSDIDWIVLPVLGFIMGWLWALRRRTIRGR